MRITTTIGGAIAAATLAAVAANPALAAKPKKSPFLKTLAKYELGVVSIEGSTSVTGTNEDFAFSVEGRVGVASDGALGTPLKPVRGARVVMATGTPVKTTSTSNGEYVDGDTRVDCGYTLPPALAPTGFHVKAWPAGRGRVKVTMTLPVAGWDCDKPGQPSASVTTAETPADLMTFTYSTENFGDERVESWPVDIERTWAGGDVRITQRWEGAVWLRRR